MSETARLAAAEHFLVDQQRPDGGWGYTVRNRDSFLEPTAWAISALLGRDRADEPTMNRAVEFVLSAQNEDGGWPSSPGMPSDMMTARVVSALAALPGCQAVVSRGADWLLRQELPDGGWGWCYGTTGFIETATYGIVALAAVNRLGDRARFVAYVEGLACADGGWCSHVPAKVGFAQASQPSVTPLGIVALAILGVRPGDTRLRASLGLLTGWVAQHRLTTPYSLATALWALTEIRALSSAADVRSMALKATAADGSWAGNIWHTSMMCYSLRRLESMLDEEPGR
jgi:squalene cyclase